MSIFYAKDSHSEILWTLNKYKVLPMNVLFQKSKPWFSYSRFKKVIDYLEEKKVISTLSTHTDRKIKYVYPNQEVWNKLYPNQQMIVKKESLFHDSIVAKFLLLLEEKGILFNFLLPNNYDEFRASLLKDLEPDAYFVDITNMHFALEVELTLKSRERYFEKFSKYLKNMNYHCLFYVVGDKRIFESIKRRLQEFYEEIDEISKNKIRSYLSVLYIEGLTTKTDLSKSKIEYFSLVSDNWHIDVDKSTFKTRAEIYPEDGEKMFEGFFSKKKNKCNPLKLFN